MGVKMCSEKQKIRMSELEGIRERGKKVAS